jgi:hypothetical protein
MRAEGGEDHRGRMRITSVLVWSAQHDGSDDGPVTEELDPADVRPAEPVGASGKATSERSEPE